MDYLDEKYQYILKEPPILAKLDTQLIRILRPYEYSVFMSEVKNPKTKTIFACGLYTAMRYSEMIHLHNHPEWLREQTRCVDLPRFVEKKKKRKLRGRYVWLTQAGVEAVKAFLSLDSVPDDVTIYWKLLQTAKQNLEKNYLEHGVVSIGITPKSTRKSYESWLATTYQDKFHLIVLSCGHDTTTSINHYLNLPFNKTDVDDMEPFVSGWGLIK